MWEFIVYWSEDWPNEESHGAEDKVDNDDWNDKIHNVTRGSKIAFTSWAKEKVDNNRNQQLQEKKSYAKRSYVQNVTMNEHSS